MYFFTLMYRLFKFSPTETFYVVYKWDKRTINVYVFRGKGERAGFFLLSNNTSIEISDLMNLRLHLQYYRYLQFRVLRSAQNLPLNGHCIFERLEQIFTSEFPKNKRTDG
mgnify:CR=1 FL=1